MVTLAEIRGADPEPLKAARINVVDVTDRANRDEGIA